MEIDGYAQLYEQIQAKVGNSAVAIALLQELSKDQRMNQINSERNQRFQQGQKWNINNGFQPATEKQIALMKRLKIEIPNVVTKSNASRLIDQAREEQLQRY